MNKKTFLKMGATLLTLVFVLLLWMPVSAAQESAQGEQSSYDYYTRNNVSFVASCTVPTSVGGIDTTTVTVIMNIGYYYGDIPTQLVYFVPVSWSARIGSIGDVNCFRATEFELKDGKVVVGFVIKSHVYAMEMYLNQWAQPCASLIKGL